MRHETILVLDFGGQYNQLIGRRVRDLNVYSEVHPYTKWREKIEELRPVGIIFTGGPKSVYAEGAPLCPPEVFDYGIPVLGICYGAQVIAHLLGGRVDRAERAEYGRTSVTLMKSPLFEGVAKGPNPCFMSHGDRVFDLPDRFTVTAKNDNCPVCAFEDEASGIYAVQFHPEVEHTPFGTEVLENFLFSICKAKGDWTTPSLAAEFTEDIRDRVGDGRVLLALSGGVDSSVCAALLQRAVGTQLTCIFVDTGLMRKHEGDEVEAAFSKFDLQFIRVNAERRFLEKLKGISDPERKRKIIGEEFIRVFEEEAKKIGAVDFLAQGTIYPDIIESGVGDAALIKSHHNVGGLPDHIDFKEIIEPLRLLFKDEVRRLGTELGLPDHLVYRQPFPGPGLGIRVVGEVTKDRLDVLRDADAIFREEVAAYDTGRKINQYFVVMTDVRSVGVMGDGRTYDYMLALRAVSTVDFMTAEVAEIPYDVLLRASRRIVAEVGHVNRIVYDITSKPPATIEWE